jgi:hypothetical protein
MVLSDTVNTSASKKPIRPGIGIIDIAVYPES